MEKFSERHGLSGALIADMEFAKGIGRLAGLTVIETDHALKNEVDYEKKGKAVLDALQEKDLVCLHMTGCDEASRFGDLKAKVNMLESVDYFILSKIREWMESHKESRILLTPCHASLWKTKRHVRDSVPFLLAGKNVMPDDIEKFSELTAKTSDLKFSKGLDLLQNFLSK